MSDQPTKRPTLKDLARSAGVSLASASYAVNGTGSLGAATRTHILGVAEEIGYRQNMSARATRTGRTGALGLVVPDLTNQFFPTLAQAVIQEARRHDYQVFVTDSEGDEDLERETIGKLVERGVDGLIWFPIGDTNTAGTLIDTVPTVVVDRTLPGLESVQADYSDGGQQAAAHLLAMGHRRIGIVSGPTDILSMRQRCDAAAAVVEAQDGAQLEFRVTNAFTVDLEAAVIEAIESRAATAIFVGADVIALGIMRHAERCGLRVPDDLSIVGFDDIPWAQWVQPMLTTIDMPLQAMAIEAVEAVVRRITHSVSGRRRTVLDVALVERGTVLRLGK